MHDDDGLTLPCWPAQGPRCSSGCPRGPGKTWWSSPAQQERLSWPEKLTQSLEHEQRCLINTVSRLYSQTLELNQVIDSVVLSTHCYILCYITHSTNWVTILYYKISWQHHKLTWCKFSPMARATTRTAMRENFMVAGWARFAWIERDNNWFQFLVIYS